jgi:transposase-like protein
MRDHRRADQSQTVEAIAPPSACPSCRGSDITTTSKNVNTETYWRCVACGEVWNVGRRETTSRRSTFDPFRSDPFRR